MCLSRTFWSFQHTIRFHLRELSVKSFLFPKSICFFFRNQSCGIGYCASLQRDCPVLYAWKLLGHIYLMRPTGKIDSPNKVAMKFIVAVYMITSAGSKIFSSCISDRWDSYMFPFILVPNQQLETFAPDSIKEGMGVSKMCCSQVNSIGLLPTMSPYRDYVFSLKVPWIAIFLNI